MHEFQLRCIFNSHDDRQQDKEVVAVYTNGGFFEMK